MEKTSLTAQGSLSLADALLFGWRRTFRSLPVTGPVFILLFGFINLQDVPAKIWRLRLGADAARALWVQVSVHALMSVLLVTVTYVVLMALMNCLSVLLLGKERRRLTINIDDERIVTRDAMGAELAIPWTNVRSAKFGRRLLILRVKPRINRFIPLRWFSPADEQRLREIVARITG